MIKHRKFIIWLVAWLAFFIVSVLWALKTFLPQAFGFYGLTWAAAIFCGILGVCFLAFAVRRGRSFPSAQVDVQKKSDRALAAIFLSVAAVSLVCAAAVPFDIYGDLFLCAFTFVLMFCMSPYAPIFAIVLAVTIILAVIQLTYRRSKKRSTEEKVCRKDQ